MVNGKKWGVVNLDFKSRLFIFAAMSGNLRGLARDGR